MANPNDKLKSFLAEPGDSAGIQAKYEQIYQNSDVWLYKRSHGVHSIVCSLLGEQLRGQRLLDVGCGAGRLALMAAELGAVSTGFDFSEAAVAIARLNAQCTGHAATFKVADIHDFCHSSSAMFDIVTMIGVLEHVENPAETLADVRRVMVPGGILVVSCPNFINPRGFSYMSLLTLLHLPMSLADVRQVDFIDIAAWCQETGFVLERSVGALYRSGWDDRGATDMIRRVPLAFEDAQLAIRPDYDRFNTWQERMGHPGRMVLAWLEAQGILSRVQPVVRFNLRRFDVVDDSLWSNMTEYLHENITADPYYCELPPFSHLGGEGIYIIRNPAERPLA